MDQKILTLPPQSRQAANNRLRARPQCRRCDGSDPELRHCSRNNGIAWQCRNCGRMVGEWIPHSRLPGLSPADLPEWVQQ
jgi:hypothetical protein